MPRKDEQKKVGELKLGDFIYQVKDELLRAQKERQGEEGYLELHDVELEVTIGATYGGDGRINIQVLQLGSKLERVYTHKVKLTLGQVSNPAGPRTSGRPHQGALAGIIDSIMKDHPSTDAERLDLILPASASVEPGRYVFELTPDYKPGRYTLISEEQLQQLKHKKDESNGVDNIDPERDPQL